MDAAGQSMTLPPPGFQQPLPDPKYVALVHAIRSELSLILEAVELETGGDLRAYDVPDRIAGTLQTGALRIAAIVRHAP